MLSEGGSGFLGLENFVHDDFVRSFHAMFQFEIEWTITCDDPKKLSASGAPSNSHEAPC